MIHRVYICGNLNSLFVVQHCYHIEDCNINNLVLPSASNFSLKSQVQSKEEEHMFRVSTKLLQDSIDKDRVPYDRGVTSLLASIPIGHMVMFHLGVSVSIILATSFVFVLCRITFKYTRRRGRLFIKKGRMMRT